MSGRVDTQSGQELGCVDFQTASNQSEQGSAMVEFAIAGPLFVLLLFFLVDISLLLINFAAAEQAVREGVRTAAKIPPVLTDGTLFTDHDTVANIAACNAPIPPPPAATLDCGFVLITSRIRRTMELQGMQGWGVEFTNPVDFAEGPSIDVEFTQPSATDVTDDRLTIDLAAEYKGFFGNYDLTVNYEGPWLYQFVNASP